MIKVKELECGVKLVSEQLDGVKSVAMGIFVKAGAVDEEPEISGISHYIEHMLFKGTETRSAKQIAIDTDKIAGQSNAFTGREMTCYYIKTLSENMEKGAEILLDMFMNSRFDAEEMARERNVIFEEMKMIEDAPDDIIMDIIGEMVFRGNPLAKSIIGTRESLMNIKRSDILDYRHEKYAQNSVVVAVSGCFDEDVLADMLNRAFESLRKEKVLCPAESADYEPHYYSKARDIEQAHICLATRSVKWDSELYYAMTLLSSIIGGSMSSRLFQSIREERGLAYAVFSGNSSCCDMGMFDIYAGVAQDKIEETIAAIKNEIRLIDKSLVTAEELEMAKTQLKGSYIFGLESVNSRMFSIGRNLTLHGRVVTPDDVISAIDGVTMDDMRSAADIICDFDNYCGAVISGEEVPVEKYIRG